MISASYTKMQHALCDFAMNLRGDDGAYLFALGYAHMPKNLDDPRGVTGGDLPSPLDSSAEPAPLVKLPAIACYHSGDGPVERDADSGAVWAASLTSVLFVDWDDAYRADQMLNERLWALRQASEADWTLGGRLTSAGVVSLRREPRITSISGYLTRTAEVVWSIVTGV